MEPSTIAAIATPVGRGGIGIVKISGPEAVASAAALFRPSKSGSPFPDASWVPRSRYFYYGHVMDPAEARLIDEAMLVVMRAPCSYTGEDVVEIQAHGGPLVLETILELLHDRGVELAKPGEFTQRAFLRGRIDLSQAEAVMDLIQAKTSEAVDLALKQLTGALGSQIHAIKSSLRGLTATLEATIDFPDEAGEGGCLTEMADHISATVLYPIERLLHAHATRRFVRDGFRIVIAGRPNAGKSSIMNCLLGRDRAIVTDLPGTTRDIIEDSFVAQGIPVIVADTAGIHDRPGPVEKIGIDMALKEIEAADLVLLVIDASQRVEEGHFFFLEQLKSAPVLLVLNKTDICDSFEIPGALASIPVARTSAKFHQGIESLKNHIARFAQNAMKGGRGQDMVPNIRQKLALERAWRSASDACQGLREGQPEEGVLVDIYSAMEALAEITGETARPDILDQIFARFCIGK